MFSPSHLCASCPFCLPLSTLSLQAVPPALLLCCAEELLLGTAVSLQRCPLARSSPGAQEPGPAQQHRPSPRPPLLCPPPGSLHVSLGLQGSQLLQGSRVSPGEHTWKQTRGNTDQPSLNTALTESCSNNCPVRVCRALGRAKFPLCFSNYSLM